MKGNEARIVLFLHPVKEFKEGQVSKAKPTSMILGFRSILLILGTTFALGVLAYVLYSFTNKQFTHVEVISTTADPLKTLSYQTDTPALTTESEVQPTKPVVSTSTTDTTEEGTKATTSNTTTTAVTPTPGS